jgi:hypothetical protein
MNFFSLCLKHSKYTVVAAFKNNVVVTFFENGRAEEKYFDLLLRTFPRKKGSVISFYHFIY